MVYGLGGAITAYMILGSHHSLNECFPLISAITKKQTFVDLIMQDEESPKAFYEEFYNWYVALYIRMSFSFSWKTFRAGFRRVGD